MSLGLSKNHKKNNLIINANIKKIKQVTQPQKNDSQKKLVLMWSLMFLGYFLFVFQWYSITNFSGGWGQAFYQNGIASNLVTSVPNWMITLGRSIGSLLAGFFIAKFGHKYAVVFCLSLMVIAFPYIIVAQNQGWNSLSIAGGSDLAHDGEYATAVAGFSLFVIFRIFLAIGGTTLITYTNSVIAKMPQNQRGKFITLNSFGFNMGAFIGNIIFVIPAVRTGISSGPVWTGILSALIVLIAIIDIVYIVTASEVVPKASKANFSEAEKWNFKKVLKLKENYSLYIFYAIWLIAVVYSNSTTFRNFIETSPANLYELVKINIANNSTNITSISKTDYAWVWPAYISLFVVSYVVSAFTLAKFNKSIFNRKSYVATLMIIGLMFLLIGDILVYVLGYGNSVALAFFLIFGFISGIFLWGTQPIVLFIPQQQSHSNPEYVGVCAGIVWGIGYFGYTIADASLSSIATYVGRIDITQETMAKWINDYTVNGSVSIPMTSGLLTSFLLFWFIMLLSFITILGFPKTGYKKDGNFIEFTRNWNPLKFSNWKFNKFAF